MNQTRRSKNRGSHEITFTVPLTRLYGLISRVFSFENTMHYGSLQLDNIQGENTVLFFKMVIENIDNIDTN